MGGGGVCRKFESFVGNLGGFVPPPEKVNFRHWIKHSYLSACKTKENFDSAEKFRLVENRLTHVLCLVI